MQTVTMSWPHAMELSVVLGVASVGLRAVPERRVRWIAPWALEAGIIAFLYGLWQFLGRWSITGMLSAVRRAHWIMHAEHDLRLPSEHDVQNLILGHPLLVQAANLYYDSMHFTMMFVFLLWLFLRHREHYRPVRTTMALATLGCLLVQLVPVAPPRMIWGFVDTAKLYGQSVYDHGLAVDQLSAMPSVHVAWAVVVGYYTVRISPSRWRWIAAVHTALTVFVVVATANHWWADGIVATSIVIASAWLRYGATLLARRAYARVRPVRTAPADRPIGARAGVSAT